MWKRLSAEDMLLHIGVQVLLDSQEILDKHIDSMKAPGYAAVGLGPVCSPDKPIGLPSTHSSLGSEPGF